MQIARKALFAAGLGLALLPALAARGGAEGLNEPPKGFIALFNGKDLTNWQGLVELPKRARLSPAELKAEQEKANERMRAHWSVRDGILVFDGKGDSLQTARDYGNFELYVDWKILPQGDSGIYLRGNPQVQIWDNPIGSGGLFNNKNNPSKPLVVADRPVGEWNTFYIKMVGDRVTVKLNDRLVVDNVPLENYWEPGKPLPARGPIELQNHGNVLEFRNVFFKELPDSAAREGDGTVTLEVSKVPLSQVIQLLATDVEIILKDPDGTLAKQEIAFISIRRKTVAQAVELLARAVGLTFSRSPDGVYTLARVAN